MPTDDQPLHDDLEASAARSGRDGLAAQLRELEAFVTRADASGDALPPEAAEMVERLREIVAALDGLTASLGDAGAAPARPDDASPEQG